MYVLENYDVRRIDDGFGKLCHCVCLAMSSFRRIFPALDFGMASMNSTLRTFLWGATCKDPTTTTFYQYVIEDFFYRAFDIHLVEGGVN